MEVSSKNNEEKTECKAELLSPEDAKNNRLKEIQTWWEIPAIAHFCSLFKAVFGFCDFDIEDLEEALITSPTQGGSTLVLDIICQLLNGCYARDDIKYFNYDLFLKDIFKQRWQVELGRRSPLAESSFLDLTVRERVEVLHALCDLRLDADDVEEVLKGLSGDSLRVDPLGQDGGGSKYWYFFGTRLYREQPDPDELVPEIGSKKVKKNLSESLPEDNKSADNDNNSVDSEGDRMKRNPSLSAAPCVADGPLEDGDQLDEDMETCEVEDIQDVSEEEEDVDELLHELYQSDEEGDDKDSDFEEELKKKKKSPKKKPKPPKPKPSLDVKSDDAGAQISTPTTIEEVIAAKNKKAKSPKKRGRKPKAGAKSRSVSQERPDSSMSEQSVVRQKKERKKKEVEPIVRRKSSRRGGGGEDEVDEEMARLMETASKKELKRLAIDGFQNQLTLKKSRTKKEIEEIDTSLVESKAAGDATQQSCLSGSLQNGDSETDKHTTFDSDGQNVFVGQAGGENFDHSNGSGVPIIPSDGSELTLAEDIKQLSNSEKSSKKARLSGEPSEKLSKMVDKLSQKAAHSPQCNESGGFSSANQLTEKEEKNEIVEEKQLNETCSTPEKASQVSQIIDSSNKHNGQDVSSEAKSPSTVSGTDGLPSPSSLGEEDDSASPRKTGHRRKSVPHRRQHKDMKPTETEIHQTDATCAKEEKVAEMVSESNQSVNKEILEDDKRDKESVEAERMEKLPKDNLAPSNKDVTISNDGKDKGEEAEGEEEDEDGDDRIIDLEEEEEMDKVNQDSTPAVIVDLYDGEWRVPPQESTADPHGNVQAEERKMDVTGKMFENHQEYAKENHSTPESSEKQHESPKSTEEDHSTEAKNLSKGEHNNGGQSETTYKDGKADSSHSNDAFERYQDEVDGVVSATNQQSSSNTHPGHIDKINSQSKEETSTEGNKETSSTVKGDCDIAQTVSSTVEEEVADTDRNMDEDVINAKETITQGRVIDVEKGEESKVICQVEAVPASVDPGDMEISVEVSKDSGEKITEMEDRTYETTTEDASNKDADEEIDEDPVTCTEEIKEGNENEAAACPAYSTTSDKDELVALDLSKNSNSVENETSEKAASGEKEADADMNEDPCLEAVSDASLPSDDAEEAMEIETQYKKTDELSGKGNTASAEHTDTEEKMESEPNKEDVSVLTESSEQAVINPVGEINEGVKEEVSICLEQDVVNDIVEEMVSQALLQVNESASDNTVQEKAQSKELPSSEIEDRNCSGVSKEKETKEDAGSNGAEVNETGQDASSCGEKETNLAPIVDIVESVLQTVVDKVAEKSAINSDPSTETNCENSTCELMEPEENNEAKEPQKENELEESRPMVCHKEDSEQKQTIKDAEDCNDLQTDVTETVPEQDRESEKKLTNNIVAEICIREIESNEVLEGQDKPCGVLVEKEEEEVSNEATTKENQEKRTEDALSDIEPKEIKSADSESEEVKSADDERKKMKDDIDATQNVETAETSVDSNSTAEEPITVESPLSSESKGSGIIDTIQDSDERCVSETCDDKTGAEATEPVENSKDSVEKETMDVADEENLTLQQVESFDTNTSVEQMEIDNNISPMQKEESNMEDVPSEIVAEECINVHTNEVKESADTESHRSIQDLSTENEMKEKCQDEKSASGKSEKKTQCSDALPADSLEVIDANHAKTDKDSNVVETSALSEQSEDDIEAETHSSTGKETTENSETSVQMDKEGEDNEHTRKETITATEQEEVNRQGTDQEEKDEASKQYSQACENTVGVVEVDKNDEGEESVPVDVSKNNEKELDKNVEEEIKEVKEGEIGNDNKDDKLRLDDIKEEVKEEPVKTEPSPHREILLYPDSSKGSSACPSRWKLVCESLEQWTELATQIGDSYHGKRLAKLIREDFIPEIPAIIADMEKARLRRAEEMQPKRSSYRLELKKQEEEEIERQQREVEEEEEKQKLLFEEERRQQMKIEEEKRQQEEKERARKDRAKRALLREERAKLIAEGKEIPPELMNGLRQDESVEDEDIFPILKRILTNLQDNELSWPFLDPVEESNTSDYFDMVSEPKDFLMIEKNLEDRTYKDVESFERDVNLVFDNCLMYHGKDSDYGYMAEKLKGIFERSIRRAFRVYVDTPPARSSNRSRVPASYRQDSDSDEEGRIIYPSKRRWGEETPEGTTADTKSDPDYKEDEDEKTPRSRTTWSYLRDRDMEGLGAAEFDSYVPGHKQEHKRQSSSAVDWAAAAAEPRKPVDLSKFVGAKFRYATEAPQLMRPHRMPTMIINEYVSSKNQKVRRVVAGTGSPSDPKFVPSPTVTKIAAPPAAAVSPGVKVVKISKAEYEKLLAQKKLTIVDANSKAGQVIKLQAGLQLKPMTPASGTSNSNTPPATDPPSSLDNNESSKESIKTAVAKVNGKEKAESDVKARLREIQGKMASKLKSSTSGNDGSQVQQRIEKTYTDSKVINGEYVHNVAPHKMDEPVENVYGGEVRGKLSLNPSKYLDPELQQSIMKKDREDRKVDLTYKAKHGREEDEETEHPPRKRVRFADECLEETEGDDMAVEELNRRLWGESKVEGATSSPKKSLLEDAKPSVYDRWSSKAKRTQLGASADPSEPPAKSAKRNSIFTKSPKKQFTMLRASGPSKRKKFTSSDEPFKGDYLESSGSINETVVKQELSSDVEMKYDSDSAATTSIQTPEARLTDPNLESQSESEPGLSDGNNTPQKQTSSSSMSSSLSSSMSDVHSQSSTSTQPVDTFSPSTPHPCDNDADANSSSSATSLSSSDAASSLPSSNTHSSLTTSSPSSSSSEIAPSQSLSSPSNAVSLNLTQLSGHVARAMAHQHSVHPSAVSDETGPPSLDSPTSPPLLEPVEPLEGEVEGDEAAACPSSLQSEEREAPSLDSCEVEADGNNPDDDCEMPVLEPDQSPPPPVSLEPSSDNIFQRMMKPETST